MENCKLHLPGGNGTVPLGSGNLPTGRARAQTTALRPLGALDPAERFHCASLIKGSLGLTNMHLLTDYGPLSVPLIILLFLKSMSTFYKIRLGALFSVGAVSAVASVVRVILMMRTASNVDETKKYNNFNL